ncbi:immunoglobulin superfamily member 1-like [Numida meleagris]|uniref:immunoglobulin superfamily member 1-like n=1 Tax=Numida meleagris TaxID=8996 RepID=UPI000B3DABE5|nr:immunoglobulin superfamily member 1-like [Numida meleagris]
MCKDTDKEQDAVEFYLADIKQEDAVKYQCQYRVLEPPGTSEKSDPVALLVTDPSYPPPNISLSPEEHVEMGTNVTIRCWNKPYQGSTFLHKDGHSAPIQHQDPDGGGTATFTLFRVSPADSGTYRCSYRVGGCCLFFSPLGDNVTLEVIPTPALPGDNGGLSWNPVSAVVGRCAAAIIFIFVLVVSILLAAHRRRIQRNESPGAPLRSPNAVQFQVSVWVRGPQNPTCPFAPPPDLTREPQTLPVGTSRNSPHFMASQSPSQRCLTPQI